MSSEHKDTMQERILQKIKSREVTMRPRAYFSLKIAALTVVGLSVLVVSIFICNFILFSIRLNSHDTLLSFGPRGVEAFLIFFPWGMLLIDIGLIILLEWLLRQFRFGYKSPALYLLLALLVVTLSVSFFIDRGTDLNDRALHRADRHGFPDPLGSFFTGARRPASQDQGFCRCIVQSINGNILVVKSPYSTTTIQVILPLSDARATTTGIQVGDTVMVAGDVDKGTIKAFGVHKVLPEDRPPETFEIKVIQ